jgi:hypothetical protein
VRREAGAGTGEKGVRVGVFAKADLQAISGVPGCDQVHHRPRDPRTGFPVPIWELICTAHEAWICGEGRQKVINWEPDGNGGFRQVKLTPMAAERARSIADIPMTPDQIRAETRRNSLTRRAEQAALQQGMAAMAAAYDHQPATSELLRARQFAGKQTVACP